MPRRFLSLFRTLWLAALAATVALWARSASHDDTASFNWRGSSSVEARWRCGEFDVTWGGPSSPRDRGAGQVSWSAYPLDLQAKVAPIWRRLGFYWSEGDGISPLATFWNRLGFSWDMSSIKGDLSGFSFPLWLPTAGLLLPFGLGLRRVWRRRGRNARGCCHGCGYDLRASTERCPECGRKIPPAPASAPAAESGRPWGLEQQARGWRGARVALLATPRFPGSCRAAWASCAARARLGAIGLGGGMLWHLPRICLWLSAMFLAVTAALWARSYYASDSASLFVGARGDLFADDTPGWHALMSRGRVEFHRAGSSFPVSADLLLSIDTGPPRDAAAGGGPFAALGFHRFSDGDGRVALLPLWLPAAALLFASVAPGLWLWRSRRRPLRYVRGRCFNCGRGLPACAANCPGCGRTVPPDVRSRHLLSSWRAPAAPTRGSSP